MTTDLDVYQLFLSGVANRGEVLEGGKASRCPTSVSPHAIRKGSITYLPNKSWPVEAVSDRADVSQEVMDMHYDKASISEKRERRVEFLDRL